MRNNDLGFQGMPMARGGEGDLLRSGELRQDDGIGDRMRDKLDESGKREGRTDEERESRESVISTIEGQGFFLGSTPWIRMSH